MRLTRRKRPLDFVGAIPPVLARLPRGINPVLTLVGDGPEHARVDALARRLGVRDRLELVGAQPRSVVRDILRRSALFVLPTLKEALVTLLRDPTRRRQMSQATRQGLDCAPPALLRPLRSAVESAG